jgi:hypothetical protein
MIKSLKDKIIDFTYVISNQPVKLHELLSANSLLLEGMHLDGERLGFRLKLGRAYVVFLFLINIVMLPIALLTHEIFRTGDCHISILITLFVTGLIFASFGLFRDWLSDEVAIRRIKRMWSLHFPLFKYDEYYKKVDDIYKKALKNNISNNELQRYIMDELSK